MIYTCSHCGVTRKAFHSRCSSCSRWNTFRGGVEIGTAAGGAVRLDKAGTPPARIRTGLPALDDVLGGGFVPGSSVLVYGEPGAGKSTLAAQAAFWAAVRCRKPALYAGGEEPWWNVSERLDRLQLDPRYLYFTGNLEVGALDAELRRLKPALLVVDSVQKLDVSNHKLAASERRVVALLDLLQILRGMRIPGLLISQINGDGSPRGGPVYEHEPDVVLQISADGVKRQLEADKNRFGRICQAQLTMTGKGLE